MEIYTVYTGYDFRIESYISGDEQFYSVTNFYTGECFTMTAELDEVIAEAKKKFSD